MVGFALLLFACLFYDSFCFVCVLCSGCSDVCSFFCFVCVFVLVSLFCVVIICFVCDV